MRDAYLSSLVAAATVAVALLGEAGPVRADWRDPIDGGSTILPAQFETGEAVLTVHATPLRRGSAPEDERLAPGRRAHRAARSLAARGGRADRADL